MRKHMGMFDTDLLAVVRFDGDEALTDMRSADAGRA